MPDFSLLELASDLGEDTANQLRNLANKAGNFVCGLYKDYPAALVKNVPDSMLRAFWDELCRDRPPGLPSIPASPFIGGQCRCQVYFVRAGIVAKDGTDLGTTQDLPFWGEIGGARVVYGGSNGDAVQILSRGMVYETECQTELVWRTVYEIGFGEVGRLQSAFIKTIRKESGDDNCGNLPPSYPPVVIPPERLTTVTPITVRPGVTLSVPLVYVNPTVTVPVKVDVGGVNVKFDFNGASIKFEGDTGDTITRIEGDVTKINNDTDVIRNDIDVIRNDTNVINNTVNRVEGDVTNIVNNVNNVNTIVTNAPIPPEQIQEEPPSEDPEKEGVSNLFAVRVKLTEIPINSKQQFGVGAPNVLYAGWFEFRRGTFCFPREPIAFEEGIFRAPTGADGYAFTLYVGYRGEATVIKLDTVSEVEA
jgi:hypothetical protein